MAGASATIASDALMNPFDGELPVTRATFPNPSHPNYSHQATHAGAWLHIPVTDTLRGFDLARRRSSSILCLLPDDTMHDRPFHSDTVHGVRVNVKGYEPAERV